MLELQPPPMPYRRCSVLNLPFRRRYERVYILPEVRQQLENVNAEAVLRQPHGLCLCVQLANSLVPSEVKPSVSIATVSAVLHSKDNKHTLQVSLMGIPEPLRHHKPVYFYPVLPVSAETASASAHQEEEACDGGASAGAGPQAAAERSRSPRNLPDHPAEGA